MPQISQIGEIYASQLFWLLIFFGAVLLVVGYGMLPKIQSTVDARDGKIAADLAEAETARATADRMEEEYRALMDKSRAEANRYNGEAKAEAAKASEATVRAADQQIERRMAEAMNRIAAARDAAGAEIEAMATEAAQSMIAKVSSVSVDAAAARAAVAKELAHG